MRAQARKKKSPIIKVMKSIVLLLQACVIIVVG
jgi:hypothetical protein